MSERANTKRVRSTKRSQFAWHNMVSKKSGFNGYHHFLKCPIIFSSNTHPMTFHQAGMINEKYVHTINHSANTKMTYLGLDHTYRGSKNVVSSSPSPPIRYFLSRICRYIKPSKANHLITLMPPN